MKASSWISAVVAAAVLFSGPVMPLVAWAQTQPADQPQVAQATPATPATPAPAVPAPPPPPPPPKQLMIEPSLIDRQPVPMPYSNLPPAVDPVTSTEPTTGDAVGAGFLNVIYVPGKAIICTAGTLTSVLVMLLTFGSGFARRRACSTKAAGATGSSRRSTSAVRSLALAMRATIPVPVATKLGQDPASRTSPLRETQPERVGSSPALRAISARATSIAALTRRPLRDRNA